MRWSFDQVEEELLRTLTGSLAEVLEGADPRDLAVQRLFPPAVRGDDEADEELRRLVHGDLAGVKRAGLDALEGLLDRAERRGNTLRVLLDEEETLLVLGVLNDLRLAIGARIGIEDIDRDDVDPSSSLGYRLAVMDHLGGLQELLLDIVDPSATTVHRLHRGEPPDPSDPSDPWAPGTEDEDR